MIGHSTPLSAYAKRAELRIAEPDAAGEVECDVAIIGSGMGGATLAYALRASGLDVVIVERGDFLPREIDNWSTESVFGKGRYRNSDTWYNGHTGAPFKPGVFYYVGGNTKLYGAMLPRFREEDFSEIQHAEGVSPAWPVSYAEFEPWYAQAEALYWVHGAAGTDPTDPWRSGPYPSPALPIDPALAPFASSLKKSGLTPFVMPAGIDYGQGRPCVLCATCDGYPCLVDAKRDAEISALWPALDSGKVRLLPRTIITKLETSLDGTSISGAIGKTGDRDVRINAKRFILACGAANSATLLLRSANGKHDRGLGNSSDLLGRNYMVHNSTFLLAIDPRRKNDVSFQKTIAINDWYKASSHSQYPLGNVQMLGKIREQMITPMKPWIPKFVSRYLTDHSIDLYLTSEDLPDRENRVTFDQDRKAINVFWTPNNLSAHRGLVRKISSALKASGYPLILTERMGIGVNSHQCGTAVFGTDPNRSVLDRNCKMHDLDNLWVVDSSFFPSSTAVNPALTIAANALRVANSLLK
jgi:choline dehydrogenase-like flavoprotein